MDLDQGLVADLQLVDQALGQELGLEVLEADLLRVAAAPAAEEGHRAQDQRKHGGLLEGADLLGRALAGLAACQGREVQLGAVAALLAALLAALACTAARQSGGGLCFGARGCQQAARSPLPSLACWPPRDGRFLG